MLLNFGKFKNDAKVILEKRNNQDYFLIGEIYINIKGSFWGLFYLRQPPWDYGKPQKWLVALVEKGRLKSCKTIDLGCGQGNDSIYLTKKGFDVIGVDFSTRAIKKAKQRARNADLNIKFMVDDVTNLRNVSGKFQLVVDNGCLHTIIGKKARDNYVKTVLNITKPGSHYFLRCFIKDPERRINPITSLFRLSITEVEQRFGNHFEIDEIRKPFPGMVVHILLMTRKSN